MSNFSKILRNIRLERNISQAELAKALSFGYTAISNYESGRNEPSIDTLIKIADYFDVSIDYLVGREEQRKCDMPIRLMNMFEKLTEKEKKAVYLQIRFLAENK